MSMISGEPVIVVSNGVRFQAKYVRPIAGKTHRALVEWRNARDQKRFSTVNTKRMSRP